MLFPSLCVCVLFRSLWHFNSMFIVCCSYPCLLVMLSRFCICHPLSDGQVFTSFLCITNALNSVAQSLDDWDWMLHPESHSSHQILGNQITSHCHISFLYGLPLVILAPLTCIKLLLWAVAVTGFALININGV